ncbi:MAG: tRNA(Ile)-lysidine synthase [Herminiimonas sp.]|nr:tRNA(Ile)-lysidine synthase [Herminiimonas sp.]
MANSRKSRSPNNPAEVHRAFERALRGFLARVCVSAVCSDMRESNGPVNVGIAFSGGLDSTVLLHLASRFEQGSQGRPVRFHAFHVNHGLSPNADAWEAHCAAVADRAGMHYASSRVAVPRNSGDGMEQAARIARYAALGELCRGGGIGLLLTAHHQDDQAETVLLQLVRGAGLRGISGMADFQPGHELLGPGVALGRPLLQITRAALERVLAESGLPLIHDESNHDTLIRRNAVRHAIAPVVEAHFPGFASLLSRTAVHAQTATVLLQELAEIDHASCMLGEAGGALAVGGLRQLSPPRFDNLLRYWLHRHGVRLPSTARLAEIRGQMLGAESDMHPYFEFDKLTLHRIADRLELHPKSGLPPSNPIDVEWHGEAEIAVPSWCGRLHFDQTSGAGLARESVLNRPLTLRPRAGQERLKLALNRPSKSLKSLFQEAEIAPWRRAWLPLAYLDSELVFVAGLGMDARRLQASPGVVLRWQPDTA